MQWFYVRASFLSHELEIIWVPIAICHVWWNNHPKLSQFQAFWYCVFQTLVILNGHIDAMNNHKLMKFHIVLIKHLINAMLKACCKILMIDGSNMHLKNKSHYFWTGVYNYFYKDCITYSIWPKFFLLFFLFIFHSFYIISLFYFFSPFISLLMIGP